MISWVLKSLISAGLLFGLSEWEGFKTQSMRVLRRRITGVLLLFLSLQLVFLAIGFFAAAFFLGLAEVEGFIRPAVITGIILVALAFVVALEGVRWLRGM
ncbi:MAG: hypothetical protein AAB538_01015 [Patescibacteria group bacterium]|mgnify:CR=1 FL=1